MNEISKISVINECERYYQNLHDACGDIVSQSFQNDSLSHIARSHSFVSDLEIWLDVLSNRPESIVLKIALREYQFSLLSLLQGHYRHSFITLRLFLEMSLAMFHFSAHEIELREWMKGQRDINWNTLIDSEQGVLSKSFVKIFCEPLAEDATQYLAIAKKVYRECSEFVHGNAITHQTLPKTLQYHMATVEEWHKRLENIRLVISFALSARYIQFLNKKNLRKIELVVHDNVGHISVLRALLDESTEAI